MIKNLLFIIFLIVAGEKAIAGDIEELIANLQSSNLQTRLLAVEGLGRVKDEKAVDALLKIVVVKGEDWRIKIKVIRLLSEIEDPKVEELLVRIFNDPFLNEECPAIKWNIAIALGKDFNKGSRAVDSLIDALNYNNLLVREAAIQSLGKIGDPRAVPFLIQALNDKSFAIKFSTIRALGDIGDPQAIHFIKQIADNDNDPYIKGEALLALKKFSLVSD
jgi:HEAT repeat protein